MKFQRTFVLGLDGMPHSMIFGGNPTIKMPNLLEISQKGTIKRMNSVYPTISSVAWTGYATGKNPGYHNIFGFVDRNPNPFSIFIPTAIDRKAETIWSYLSDNGKKVIVVNVPLTYPPQKVNGIMVACFLCSNYKKLTYPSDYSSYLGNKGYIIDVDAWLAKESKSRMLDELFKAMRRRFEIAFEMMDNEEWDFFQLHIMETDRLMHFFWNGIENDETLLSSSIKAFFSELDIFIGKLYAKLSDDTSFLILSDHGFCGIKSEVQLNKWLESKGMLKFEKGQDKTITNYRASSLCYSLLPGRIYINLEGREEKGTVKVSEYRNTCEFIMRELSELTDPGNNKKIIKKIFLRDEIYDGPYVKNAADIIIHPENGYDLKGALDENPVFSKSHLEGMHTYDDALILGINIDVSNVNSIIDVAGSILGGNINDRF